MVLSVYLLKRDELSESLRRRWSRQQTLPSATETILVMTWHKNKVSLAHSYSYSFGLIIVYQSIFSQELQPVWKQSRSWPASHLASTVVAATPTWNPPAKIWGTKATTIHARRTSEELPWLWEHERLYFWTSTRGKTLAGKSLFWPRLCSSLKDCRILRVDG